MEIHVQLAGIKLGPYSEKQVQQYLKEGLLSLSDPARLEGSDNWMPVRELLASLPPPVAAQAIPPEESPPAPLPSPVVAPVVAPQSQAPFLGPAPVPFTPTKAEASQAVPVLKTEAVASAVTPLPAPSAAPVKPETKRVAMSLVVQSLAKRSAQGLKKAPGQHPKAISTSSPMPSPSDVGIKPPEAKKEEAPPAAQALAPATPSLSATTTVRPPPPNPATSMAQQMTRTALPLVVKALAEKSATSAPVADNVRPSSQAASPISTPPVAPAQVQKPAATSTAKVPDLKTNRVKMPAPVVPAAPAEVLENLDSAPPLQPEAKPSPAGSRRLVRRLIYVIAGIILAVILYVSYPYYAASSLWKALNTGDAGQLENVIDFKLVRDSLKEQMKLQVAKSAAPGAVLSMIDDSIDRYVTPEGISALAGKSTATPWPNPGQTISPEAAASILLNLNNQKVNSQGLDALNDFVIDIDLARLHLHFDGLGWKLTRIELKSSIQLPTVSVAPVTPAAPAAPLTAPVIDTYLAQGNEKCQKGDWDGAIADFTQVLTIDPKATVAYNNRGYARQSKGDLDGAIADYTQALSLDPKLATAYYSRGNAKLAKNDLDGAIADYTQALSIDPKLVGVYYQRGNAKAAGNDLDGAIADYNQTVTLDPNQANAYSNRGYVKRAKNDLDGAISDFTQALAINPKLPEAYFNRGLARQSQGNDEAAILDFNQAIDLDPKMARAYFNRGNAKNNKGDSVGAIADYTQALALDPKNAMAYCNRGLSRQSKGDLDGASEDFTQAVALDPKIAVAYYSRALIKEQKGDPEGAIADSTHALDLNPKNAQAYYNRGFATLTKGNLMGASADLQKFCEMAPRDHFADHARLYLWLIAKAQSLKSDADDALSSSLVSDWNSTPEDLVTKIAGFLLDRVTEADLVASAISSDAAKDQGQHCEVWYFIGMKRLLVGDKMSAVDYFHKCLATGQKDYCEYILAQSELRALEPAPKN